ncbi:MAG TPA: calcium-binding protein [Allosphingosinicella sp.]|nr:calcium-binding protein [Allosphingosinicella sp.]
MSDYRYSLFIHRGSGYFELSVDYSIDGYSDPETGEYFGDTAWNYSLSGGGGASSGYSSESGTVFLSFGLGSGDEVQHHEFDFTAYNRFSAEAVSFHLNMLLAGAAAGDLVIAGAADADLIVSGSGNDSVSGGGGDDHIDTGDGADTIDGGDGNDAIDGGTGADVMAGGAGDDLYYADTGTDTIVEAAGGGGDLVYALVSYTLADNVEALSLSGADARHGTGNLGDNWIYGNDSANLLVGLDGDDMLTGHGGRDLLVGGDGDDSLFGGLGRDTLEGGAGDDDYLIDARSDRVVELADAGTDTVQVFFSIASYVLGANLENLTYTGNADPFRGAGNALDNVMAGARGDDRLSGLRGDDTLAGGEGDDLLVGGEGADLLQGGLGVDTASYAGSSRGVRVDLATGLGARGDARGDVLAEIEKVVGTGLDDTLLGDANANRLVGGDGGDRIDGGGGDDILTGGGATDRFLCLLDEGRDRITDFDALGLEVLTLYGDSDFNSFEEIMAVAVAVGPDGQSTLFRFGAGCTLLLANVAIEDLTAANFGY